LAEGEEIALFMARAMMVKGTTSGLTASDSALALAIAPNDSAFVRFLNERSPATRGQHVRARCGALVGAAEVVRVQRGVEYARRENLMQALFVAGVPAARVRFRAGTPEELATWTGEPGYRLVFDAAP
jgi:hypothetical protein